MTDREGEHRALNGTTLAMAHVEHILALYANGLDATEALVRLHDHTRSVGWVESVTLARALIAGGAMGSVDGEQGRG